MQKQIIKLLKDHPHAAAVVQEWFLNNLRKTITTDMGEEFKKFISRGNGAELAVDLILATYFGAIVKSLVNDVIMPPVGILLGGVDFSDLKIVIKEANFFKLF